MTQTRQSTRLGRPMNGVPQPGTCRMRATFPSYAPLAQTAMTDARIAASAVPRDERFTDSGFARTSAAMTAFPREAWRLTLVGAVGLAVAGCAGIPAMAPQAAQPRIEPVLRLNGVAVSAEDAYVAGKQALSEGRLYLAFMQFERAASLRPDWAEPVNGKLVALARLGRVSEALDIAEAAASRGLRSTEMQHNVAILMVGEGREQSKATTIAETAQTEVDKVSVEHVPAPGRHDAMSVAHQPAPRPAKADLAPREPSLPVIVASSSAVSDTGPYWLQKAPNVLELKMDVSEPVVAMATVPLVVPPIVVEQHVDVTTQRLRLSELGIEVSNGAGKSGLAKGAAKALQIAGLRTRRITNHSNFGVTQTEIQYGGAGDLAAARLLARQLGVPVALVHNPLLHAGIKLRVVLGKDAAALAQQKRLVNLA